MDSAQIIDQAIELLKPIAAAGPSIASKVAASALWDWLKDKFKARSAAAAEAVADVEKQPAQEENWAVLRAQLAKALREDEVLRREFATLVAQSIPAPSQKSQIKGDDNKAVQIAGSDNTVNIR